MATRVGANIAFGIPHPDKPVVYEGFPIGARVRLKLRHDEFAKCYVKTATSFHCCYVLIDDNNVVRPSHFTGVNFNSLVPPPTPYPLPIKRQFQPV